MTIEGAASEAQFKCISLGDDQVLSQLAVKRLQAKKAKKDVGPNGLPDIHDPCPKSYVLERMPHPTFKPLSYMTLVTH